MGNPEHQAKPGDTVIGVKLSLAVTKMKFEYCIFVISPFHQIYSISIGAHKGANSESLLSDKIDRLLRKYIEARNINDIIVGDAMEPAPVGRIVIHDVSGDDSSELGKMLPKDWNHDRQIQTLIAIEDWNETWR